MSSSNRHSARHSQPQKPQARHYQKQEPKQNQRRYRSENVPIDRQRTQAPASVARRVRVEGTDTRPTSVYPSRVNTTQVYRPDTPRTQVYPSKVRSKPVYPSKVRVEASAPQKEKGSNAKVVVTVLSILASVAAVTAVTVLILTTIFSTVEMKQQPKPVEVEMTKPMKAMVGDMNFAVPKDALKQTASGVAATESSSEPPVYTKDNIPAITGLERVSESADGIVLKWDDIPGVKGYHIYWQDLTAKDPSYHPFATIPSAGLDIRILSSGCKYGFKIAAFIREGSNTYEGEAAEVSFSTIPASVENFRMTSQKKNATSMAWDKNERADGYLLQRCVSGEWSDYQTFDADTTEFTDTDLKAGKAYYYRLCSYREDSTGQLKGESAEIYTVAGLLGPKDDGSASKLGRISLDYKKSAYASGYKIYYSKDKKKWEKLTDTKRTHYSTSRLEDGKTYWFRIYPYKKVGSYKVTGDYTQMKFVAKTEIYDREVGDTYVEVSLDDQHMWFIVDGDVYLESDCVTGNYGTADTPQGFFEVNSKASPCTLEGDDYVSYVTYWMPFIGGGWGLHDATWRSSFGGSIYKGNGSHGCVNLPYSIAEQMYAVIEIGTPVIVY